MNIVYRQKPGNFYHDSRRYTVNPKNLLTIILFFLLQFGLISPSVAQRHGMRSGSLIAELLEDLKGSVQGYAPASADVLPIRLSSDGFVRYLGSTPGNYYLSTGSPEPESRARAFMGRWGNLFFKETSKSGYETVKVTGKGKRFYVRFQQIYEELPVFGAEIIVQLDDAMHVTNVHSDIMRDFLHFEMGRVGLNPTISDKEARSLAIEKVVGPGNQGTATEAQLMIYNPTVVGTDGTIQLVWQTIVRGTLGPPLEEMALVNAHTGSIALRYPLIHDVKYREIYDANNSPANPGILKRIEGDPPVLDIIDVNQIYDYLGDTYDFYLTEHGRDSYDSAGGILSATVRYCEPIYPCPLFNAYWHTIERRMYLGEGFSAADDVIAHEMTHGVTDLESRLIYFSQSGAINESFSDIWGEFVDLTNTAGTDTPLVRWQLGEDIPSSGAIRDMSDPPVFAHPDRMGSSLYYVGTDDLGGVHINSGVNNKLCYLLTDGASFNGYTITGMGIPKVADLYYECQTNLLTSSSDYFDLYVSLIQAAINLSFTQEEQDNIQKACKAVEIDISRPETFCEGYCGEQSPEGCFCDENCHSYGDCCPDKCDFCPSSNCPCHLTISPSSIEVEPWEGVHFMTIDNGECDAPCYVWDILIQESTGSSIDVNGLYTAGENPGKDIITVTDMCNGNISDAAIVTVYQDSDHDGIPNMHDNCPDHPNGPYAGTCIKGILGNSCATNEECHTEGLEGVCSIDQEDSYPPQENNCGDACECEGNFDGDQDQDGVDAFIFKEHFGRSAFLNPCTEDDPCDGNFNCDNDCDGADAFIFKEDFGRSSFLNPCSDCVAVPWCTY